ncbi:MAG: Coenzyme F420 hydrogenase/dehydrogenase, beta subunit C-terminal domain [Lentisphaerota bacterium]
MLELFTGHSLDESVRQRSSSGGLIRECCRHALETHQVDGIITLRHDAGMSYVPHLYQTTADLVEHMPCSIYHNVSFERVFEILKTMPGRFLLIALPCQLTAVRKWLRLLREPPPGELALTIGLICGWMYSWNTIKHFARSQGVHAEELSDVAYRGGDAVGRIRLHTPNGNRMFHRRPQYAEHSHTAAFRVAFSRTYASQRCLVCVEHLNYLADIAVGDAWLDRFSATSQGESLILVRSQKGRAFISALQKSGRLELQCATPSDVVEAQNVFAKAEPAVMLHNRMRVLGAWVPRFVRPFTVSAKCSYRHWFKNFLNPSLTRLTWRVGVGYGWFCLRVIRWGMEESFWQSKTADWLRAVKRRLCAGRRTQPRNSV